MMTKCNIDPRLNSRSGKKMIQSIVEELLTKLKYGLYIREIFFISV